ncbi:MAG: Gfo/Idh/MocA family oxidoreductase [Planctomycetes bacterium]|nr:Gfo/Idh/MocA family oxidoreductase [Planctomycetota bacterium]
MAKSRRIRAAVIGLGMGRYHATNYAACPEAELVALCDADEDRLRAAAKQFGVKRVYTRIDDLAEDRRVEAVSVALPNFLHAPVSIQMLEAGKHTMCEKPMAMNAREAEEMERAARKSGRLFMMHFNTRFAPASQYLKKVAESGRLGEVYYAKTGWLRRAGIPGAGGWFTTRAKSGGGPLIDLGVHRIDLALWVLGHPRPVAVTGMTYARFGPKLPGQAGDRYDVEDLACGFVRFANGLSMQVEASWASFCERREEMVTVLYGDRGGVEHSNMGEGYDWGVKLFRSEGGRHLVEQVKSFPAPKENAQSHFIHCIQKGRQPMATARHGVYVMKILDALYESARTGREVRLDGN